MLEEERTQRDQVLDSKYQKISHLEAKFAAMIEDEIQVSIYDFKCLLVVKER